MLWRRLLIGMLVVLSVSSAGARPGKATHSEATVSLTKLSESDLGASIKMRQVCVPRRMGREDRLVSKVSGTTAVILAVVVTLTLR